MSGIRLSAFGQLSVWSRPQRELGRDESLRVSHTKSLVGRRPTSRKPISMNREYHKWWSPRLGRDMELLVFGHAGLPAIVFPTSQGRFFEFEDRGMVGAIWRKIESGGLQLYCVDSVDSESWYNKNVPPRWRIARHVQYEDYVLHEVVPLIKLKNSRWDLATTGCSFGAYHAMNLALRHPDLVSGSVSMGGAFDIIQFLNGYYDD